MNVWVLEYGNIYEGTYDYLVCTKESMDKALIELCEMFNLNMDDFSEVDFKDEDYAEWTQIVNSKQQLISATKMEVI